MSTQPTIERRTLTAVVEVTIDADPSYTYTATDLADDIRDMVVLTVREETNLDPVIITVTAAPEPTPEPRLTITFTDTKDGLVAADIKGRMHPEDLIEHLRAIAEHVHNIGPTTCDPANGNHATPHNGCILR
jgi:hypothetical protein